MTSLQKIYSKCEVKLNNWQLRRLQKEIMRLEKRIGVASQERREELEQKSLEIEAVRARVRCALC